MTVMPRLHFILPPEDRSSPIEAVWREMLPSLSRRHWDVVDNALDVGFDAACDGIAVLPTAEGTVPELARIEALHARFPQVPIYRLWRGWPAYEGFYPADAPQGC